MTGRAIRNFCDTCGEHDKTLPHFLLHCPALSATRNKIILLQKPFMEDEVQIMTPFLFEKDSANDKKKDLCKLWRARDSPLDPY